MADEDKEKAEKVAAAKKRVGTPVQYCLYPRMIAPVIKDSLSCFGMIRARAELERRILTYL
jgi:hypothetical protein